MELKLIKNSFHLKNTTNSISIDKTIEERNSYKTLLNQKKELEKEEMSGGMGVQNMRPSLRSKNYINQEEAILTKSAKTLLVFCTNADNMINKGDEIRSLV